MQYAIVLLEFLISASMIVPPAKLRPYSLGTLLSVAGGNCILIPGSVPLGASITPSIFAVPIASPVATKAVAMVASVPVIPIAPTIAVAIAVNTAILCYLLIHIILFYGTPTPATHVIDWRLC